MLTTVTLIAGMALCSNVYCSILWQDNSRGVNSGTRPGCQPRNMLESRGESTATIL